MKKYIEPEIKVTAFAGESIMTLSGLNEGSLDGTLVKPTNSNADELYIEKIEVGF